MSQAQKQWPAEVSVHLYELDSDPEDLTPRKLRSFLFPPMGEHVAVDATSIISRTTNLPPSDTSSSISQDDEGDKALESLLQITFSVFPSENDIVHTYCFFIHPSSLLATFDDGSETADNEFKEVPWESWGAEKSACFILELGITPMVDLWYVYGDRVLVVGQGEHEGNGVYGYSLRVLDFRPERLKRAELIAKGVNVWPPNPPHTDDVKTGSESPSVGVTRVTRVQESDDNHREWGMYAFEGGPIRCDLPYTETKLIEGLQSSGIDIAMDNQHIILNKV